MHVSLKEATYQLFEKTLSIYFKNCHFNAPAKCQYQEGMISTLTQFNKFAAVKQADLLGFEPGQNICIVLYRAVVLNNFLEQYRK